MEENLVLTTKIHPPLLRGDVVFRERLHAKLNQGLTRKFILLSAPAGFGKTTLVVNWLSKVDIPNSWLSLDNRDNDIVIFFTYLISTLAEMIPDVDPSLLSLLHQPNQNDYQSISTFLLNRIEAFGEDCLLVLDDFHFIDDPSVQRNAAYLLANCSVNFHILMTTRADPPFRLARMRTKHELIEIRMEDLRFNRQEGERLLRQFIDAEIPEKDLARLVERTEGWAAGLQLAGISMRDKKDRHSRIEEFSGSHKLVIDYFLEEVFSGLSTEIQEFLIKTSILDRLSAKLCDAVLRTTNSREHLQFLETMNIFILPLDDKREWFRYHQLFRDLLSVRLGMKPEPEIKELHIRAVGWMRKNGFMQSAIDQAIKAETYADAVEMMGKIAEDLLKQSRFITLERWVRKIPAHFIESAPELRFYLLWAQMILSYDHAEIVRGLNDFERIGKVMDGKVDAFRSFMQMSEGNFLESGRYAQLALKALQSESSFFRQIALWCAGISQAIEMDLEKAAELLLELQNESQKSDNKMFAVLAACHLAKIFHRQGNLATAELKYQEALELARDRTGNILPIGGEVLMGLGDLYREQDDLERAVDTILEGIEYTFLWRDVAAIDGYLALSKARQAQKDVCGAYHAVDKAMVLAEKYDVIDDDDRMVALQKARILFSEGKIEAVQNWVEESGYDRLNPRQVEDHANINNILLSRELVFYARYLIEIGQLETALEWIDLQVEKFRKINKTDVLIELHLYRGLLFHLRDQKKQTITELNEALRLSEGTGFRRLFYDLGPRVMTLLRTYKKQVCSSPFLENLIKDRDVQAIQKQTEPSHNAEALSEREKDVLRYLGTNLTTPEIAEQMMIGVNTVRTHIKNIYMKLGVHKRSEAVRVSRSKEKNT